MYYASAKCVQLWKHPLVRFIWWKSQKYDIIVYSFHVASVHVQRSHNDCECWLLLISATFRWKGNDRKFSVCFQLLLDANIILLKLLLFNGECIIAVCCWYLLSSVCFWSLSCGCFFFSPSLFSGCLSLLTVTQVTFDYFAQTESNNPI